MKVFVMTEDYLYLINERGETKGFEFGEEIEGEGLKSFIKEVFNTDKLAVISLVKDRDGYKALEEILEVVRALGLDVKVDMGTVFDVSREVRAVLGGSGDIGKVEGYVRGALPMWKAYAKPLKVAIEGELKKTVQKRRKWERL